MERITIASAVNILEDLMGALKSAYWDAHTIQQKDIVFDIINILHDELNEMAKLSVEDHYMAYEPITAPLRSCSRKLKRLQANIEDWFPRTQTANHLEIALASANTLISNQN